MSLLRAEIRNRLGDSSIYDGVVEYKSDFETEKMLASVHAGSMMLCLNYDVADHQDESVVSDLYIKREDGTWEIVKGMTNELTPTPSGSEDAGKVPVVNKDGTGYDLAHIDPDNVVLYTEQALSDGQKAQARENIGAVSIDEIGTVFTLKGSVATAAQLPASGNHVGDVYYVEDISAGYIWIESESHPNGYWEELGEPFSVTVDSQFDAESTNPVQNKVISRSLLLLAEDVENKANKETVVAIEDTDAVIYPAPDTLFNCGTLTSLTITTLTTPQTSGAYSIVFTSGATPTVTTIPATILGLEDFAAEANTIYEINVLNNRAVVGSWAVSV